MNNLRKILILGFCITMVVQATAQNLSNRGRDFWVGYGHHQSMEVLNPTVPGGNQDMILYFSAEQAANVTVTINGTAYVRNYFVPANGVLASQTIPKSGTVDARLFSGFCTFVPPGFPCGGEGFFNTHAIHITSDVPIVVYAHIYDGANSGATMLLPVESWGYSYQTINSKQNYAANCFSWAYIIAQHDNTLIEVTPSQATRRGLPANVPFNITLNRGQIYQFMAGPEAGSIKPEFSGTRVRSIANAAGECYPIAVFAGSSRTLNAPVTCGAPSGGDNDNQQCFPFQVWGKKYVTAPTSNSNNASTPMWNTFKIAVKDPTTVVTRNGTPLAGLTNNTYEFLTNTADVIEADKPVMVGQFIHSGSACQGGAGVGDPEMIYISPVEQGIKRIGFYRNNRTGITVNYLTLIIPTAGISSLLIDGSSTFDHTYPHPNYPGYSVVVKRWSAAQAQSTAQSDSAFTAITYGLGSVESYGYNAGTFLNNLNAVGSIFNSSDTSTTTTSHPFTCTNTPVKLSVLLRYPTPPTRLVWRLSLVGGGLSPSTDITDNAPTPTGTQVINGITYSKYELPGNYQFTTVGTYTVPILATHPSIDNCNNTEEVSYQIEVRGKPSTNFAISHTGCVLDTVFFAGQTTSANGFNVNQWRYTFPDATVSNSKDTGKLFAAPGTYNVNLRIVSTEGCVGDTTKQVVIYPKPTASFTVADPTVCLGTAISVTPTSTYTGTPGVINSYYWNFGDNTSVTSTTNSPQTHIYTTPGTYTIKHVAGVSNLCVSDTAIQTVTIYALPTTSFTYPAGCLPANGTVQFTSTATTPDGQTITGHLWTFGDPASGPQNTSTLPNPTHTYPGFGNYTITYQTTTVNGCIKDTTVNATFNLAPAFNYPALSPVCGNTAGTVNVGTATVTNGVPGTGVYNGPGTTGAGIFDPNIAGPGTHTIWYVYTATSGCRDSVSQTITVAAPPQATFSFLPAGCLPASGVVNFTYTGTAQAGQTYAWNFGDPGSGANNTSTLQNPSHTYTAGTYTITLTVTNPSTGCTRTETVTQTFNVTPALSYPALAATCQNLTSVNVATATVTNGVTGTGVYSGPGTSASGTFNPSVAGPGTHTITYTFTSASGNCVATTTQTIVVNPKPNASFTYPTAACLPASGIANFTYNGSMSAGQTYLWNFGDPGSGPNNTSTLQNPSHTYTNTGTYSVSVTVTNTNGCVDDTVINNINFSVTPALSYPALAAVCENVSNVNIATATVTNGVTGTGVYSGPGTSAGGTFNPSVAGPGTHTITYTFTSTGNCVSTITQTIVVNAKPNASFTYPTAACLPATGIANFTYNGSMSAGQTYLWNFGDPASGPNNTSTLQNPSHTYTNTGTYSVSVTVTNTNGCVDDSVINNINFSVTPALSYPALAAVCENVTSVNVATATVTNGVTGTGVYSGPGTSAGGTFNPSVAGPGTHTITYTFTSTGNCVSTITQTIVVDPKPVATFTITPTVCLGQTANISSNATIPTGSVAEWRWFMGDNTTYTFNNGNNFTHTYANYGTYEVKLVTESANGCISDTARQSITVSPVPVAAFTMPASVCMPNGVVQFTNGSTIPDNSTLSYAWNFGDPASGANNTSTLANPTHIFTASGTYTITLTVTGANGCSSTISQTFDDFFDKPIAAFTPDATEICTGTAVRFTDGSTAPNSTISSWKYIFSDGTVLTQQSPSKSFSTPGSFTVRLVVTSAQGCISDTSAPVTITVHQQPQVNAGPDFIVAQGTSVQFLATSSTPGVNILWTPTTGLSSSTVLQPTHIAQADATYTIELSSGNGFCTATDFLTVKILRPLRIPNAFSPNGDNINDRWEIENLSDYTGAIVEVFNRYGAMVWKSAGYATPWDGTSNGKPLPLATYYYVIQLKNGFKPLSGSITLIR
jgi:gliding motility-associated-like protein